MLEKSQTRRDFLKFMGASSAALIVLPSFGLTGCKERMAFDAIKPSDLDDVVLAEGFEQYLLQSWGDPINDTESFGFNNDFIAFLPNEDNPNEGILWVNHEYTNPLFVSHGSKDAKEKMEKEQLSVGGSLLHLRKNTAGKWERVKGSQYNRRLTAQTPIPFAGGVKVAGADTAIGTFANCAGGVTPWRTFLTCEENYDTFYGEIDFKTRKRITDIKYSLHWEKLEPRSPLHYGWVVEVDPESGSAKKHTALGRFAHESATVATLDRPDKPAVVYMGDDAKDQCLYKFIADRPGSLETGTLYVANLEQGRWIPLIWKEHKKLQTKFKDQLEVQIFTREAADAVGGTKLDRPEDIEINKKGSVFVALTNNKPKNNYFGSILRIDEKNNDPYALTFSHSTFLTGGEPGGLACPDNMCFDPEGNLWVTTDISGSSMHKAPYTKFKNNGLFMIPMRGQFQGQAFQVASAPHDAEFTGPCFTPDGKTLFLSVQHPGERSKGLDKLTSHWPDGGKNKPKPSVIVLHGAALDALMSVRSLI